VDLLGVLADYLYFLKNEPVSNSELYL